jgi:hypothetical protein
MRFDNALLRRPLAFALSFPPIMNACFIRSDAFSSLTRIKCYLLRRLYIALNLVSLNIVKNTE